METVIFNRQDDVVIGLNRPAGPAEYSLSLPYSISAVKTLTRINGEKQKTNDEGKLLYYASPVNEDSPLQEREEVTTDRIAIAWEEQTQAYNLVNEDGSVTPTSSTVRVATDWEKLEPVMVPNVESYSVSFSEQPSLFTYDELLTAKLNSIKKANTGLQLLHYDEDFDPAGFSTELATHAANLGNGVIAIHPGGCCRTVKLKLDKPASEIRIYLEAQPDIKVEIGATAAEFVEVVNDIATLADPADEVYIRFSNAAEQYREIYAFGLLA